MAANADRRDFNANAYNEMKDAIQAEDVETLRRLIDTEFGTASSINSFCLYKAVDKGNIEMVKMLLDAGVDRDYTAYVRTESQPTRGGTLNSPVSRAFTTIQDTELRWKMVKLLVENGVNPNKEHLYTKSSLYRAAESGDCEMVRYLFDNGAIVNCPNVSGSPLYAAIYCLDGEARVKMVKLLIELGADVKYERPAFQDTCLHVVGKQESGRCEVFKLLIDAGAQLNHLDKRGFSPLALVAVVGDCELMRRMIAAGADVNLSKKCTASPLHMAICYRHKDAVQLLLDKGADPNAKDANETNILRVAAIFGEYKVREVEYIDILKILFAHGARNYCTRNMNMSPFLSALCSGTMEAINIFFENGVTLDNCGLSYLLYHAAGNDSKGILKHLLESHRYDVDEINYVNGRKYSPLHMAIQKRRRHNVELLIEYGADVNTPVTSNYENNAESAVTSPLFLALKSGDFKIVNILLSAGADMDVDTTDGVWQSVLSRILGPEYYKIFSTFVGEVVLLKSQNYSDPNNENVLMEKFANLSPEIEALCSSELEVLKNLTFYGSVTLYDLLRGSDVTRYINNIYVADTFKSHNVREYFPIYGDRIENCYSLAKVKRELTDKATKKLDKLLQYRFSRHHEILYIIITNLRLKDLRNLGRVSFKHKNRPSKS